MHMLFTKPTEFFKSHDGRILSGAALCTLIEKYKVHGADHA
jgi:hypothetical protein